MEKVIKVAIVEDKRDIAEGLRLALNKVENINCIAIYKDGETALKFIPKQKPDVAVMDIGLPGMSGIECVKRLKEKLPNLDVIILSVYDDDEHIFQSLQAGACGYLTKNIFPSRLVQAIYEITEGGAPMNAAIARRVVSSFSKFKTPSENLTTREKEVLKLLCEGISYTIIARRMNVSPNTVHFHLKNIYKKLQVNSRHEAVMLVTRKNLD